MMDHDCQNSHQNGYCHMKIASAVPPPPVRRDLSRVQVLPDVGGKVQKPLTDVLICAKYADGKNAAIEKRIAYAAQNRTRSEQHPEDGKQFDISGAHHAEAKQPAEQKNREGCPCSHLPYQLPAG